MIRVLLIGFLLLVLGSNVGAGSGAIGGGSLVDRIAQSRAGCNVGDGGREVTLPTDEVLANPPRVLPGREIVAQVKQSVSGRTKASAAVLKPQEPTLAPSIPTVPSTPAVADTTKRGFDENGRPYVEVTLVDGIIKRTQENGVTLIKPDRSTQFIPLNVLRVDAQPPTPPELPSDPTHGRVWVERHDEDLLDMIRTLVHRDDEEMRKFSEGERKTVGTDIFAQIVYRTRIATFLAGAR